MALCGLMFHRLIMIPATYSDGGWVLVKEARSIAIVQVLLPQSQHSCMFALARMIQFSARCFLPASPYIDLSSPRLISVAVYIYRTSHHMKPLTLAMPSVCGGYSNAMVNLLSSRLSSEKHGVHWSEPILYMCDVFVPVCSPICWFLLVCCWYLVSFQMLETLRRSQGILYSSVCFCPLGVDHWNILESCNRIFGWQ